jgi:hypothetical protein
LSSCSMNSARLSSAVTISAGMVGAAGGGAQESCWAGKAHVCELASKAEAAVAPWPTHTTMGQPPVATHLPALPPASGPAAPGCPAPARPSRTQTQRQTARVPCAGVTAGQQEKRQGIARSQMEAGPASQLTGQRRRWQQLQPRERQHQHPSPLQECAPGPTRGRHAGLGMATAPTARR